MIEIRLAQQSDGPVVRALLGQLGYAVGPEEIRARLAALLSLETDPILLATQDDAVLGLIAMHWTPMLHHSKPVARITALVVRDDARGNGAGRALVEAASDLAKQAGCGLVELTTALHRTDAQAFYKALGFEASSLRLHRVLQ